MLPGSQSQGRTRTPSRRYKFFRRLLNFRQLDFEVALYQMRDLCIAPHKVYRNFQYHKQTKNQWARDDPAFLVLLAVSLCITSFAFSMYFWFPWWKFIVFTLYVIFVDCVGIGAVIATINWALANKYLRQSLPHTVPENVEWAYAFDVHCNSFFPLLLILHGLQLILMPLITLDNMVSVLVANTLYLLAVSYYIYITFLGFRELPFLGNTTVFLLPIGLVFVIYVISLILRWNISRAVLTGWYGISFT
eukprot:comp19744_c0_seq1/m.23561 comp19744_c0_seq1/g.23561  ORF comp19744_c0_seq1/g.23561 comp19744_c0_seq1/m.23561 type:complete len:248 (-) comp19744_c0_seq1:552-1295(-)